MNRSNRWILRVLIVWMAMAIPGWAASRPSGEAPAKNPAFTLLESGDSFVHLRYQNPTGNQNYSFNSSIYVGIPVGATYEVHYLSWDYRPYREETKPQTMRMESLTPDDATKYQTSLSGVVERKRFEFQELDVVKFQINSLAKLMDPTGNGVSLNELEMEIHWEESPAVKPAEISPLDAGYARMFRDLCINGDQTVEMRRKRSIPENEKTQGFNPYAVGFADQGDLLNQAASANVPRMDAARVRVRKTGILAVRAHDLLNEGILPEHVNLNQARVWHQGIEIPVSILDDGDGLLGDQDAILFYGEKSDSDYTADSQYFLTWSDRDTPPKRIEEIPLEWQESGAALYPSQRIYDEGKVLVEEKSDQQYDWYCLEMDQKSKELTPDWTDIAGEGTVQVIFKTYNKARQENGFTVQIGDATAHFQFPTQPNTASSFVFSTSAANVIESSTLSITMDKEPEPYVPYKTGLSEKVGNVPHLFFDSITATYPRHAVMEHGPLWFNKNVLDASAAAIVLEVTGEAKPLSAWVVNATGEIKRLRGIPNAKPAFLLPQNDWEKMEIVYDDFVPGPYTVDLDFPSSLHRRDQGYNYLILAPQSMVPTARKLAERRTTEGFKVLLTDVQDVYDEFNYGYPDSDAIKRFFRYAQSEWTGLSPEFVVLIGDCSWDHRDRLETGAHDWIPTYAPTNDPMHDASDEWYAYLWGGSDDYFSDLIMGRISVETAEDLDHYLTKLSVYETPSVGPWKARNVYITDDDNGTFERFAITNSQQSLPPQYQPVFINEGDYPLVTNPYLYHRFMNDKDPASEEFRNKKYCPDCVSAILRQFNQGSLLLQYIGHGGNQIWSEERIFYGTDSPKSNLHELQPTTRFPFVVSWSCLTGYLNFNIPPFTICLSEELIRYPDRGAIAVWGPSGGGTTNKHMELSKLMLRNLTLDGLDRLGEAMTLTKAEFLQNDFSPDLTNQYILFGDPAVHLAMPAEKAQIQVTPNFIMPGKEQDYSIKTTLNNLKVGQALVSMTIGGKNVYESPAFDFTDGKIEYHFNIALDTISEPSAEIRVYAWNEKENRDAWGGVQIPLKEINLVIKNDTVEWEGNRPSVLIEIENPSQFDLHSISCQVRAGEKMESLLGKPLIAHATSVLAWSAEVDPDLAFLYVSIPADPEQGIQATPVDKVYPVRLRTPESSPVVPLMGLMTSSNKDMIEGLGIRFQIPFRNLSDTQASFVSASLSGIGCATDVKDATVAAGQDRRLDFPVTLPPAGDYEYNLIVHSATQESSYPIPITVVGKPDLALAEGDFSVLPEQPVIGKTVYLRTTVYNVGEGPATNVLIKAYDGDPVMKREITPYNTYQTVTIDRLEAGEIQEVTLVWDPKSYEGLGSHQINFIVDPQNRIDELSEQNNRITATINMIDLPDLEVDKWTGHGFVTQIQQGIPLWGQTLNLVGRTINSGDSDAEYVRFNFIHNGNSIAHYFDQLPKGVSEETTVSVPLLASKNTLRTVVDQFDLIGEKNEIDNTLSMGNNVSEEKRIDFQLRMPIAPVLSGRRIYRVTDESTFKAGRSEYLIYDEKHEELVLHPNLETVRYRINPAFVADENSYFMQFPNVRWQWNSRYNCFFSPTSEDVPLTLNLPAPNGVYDVYLHMLSSAYVDGKSAKLMIKTAEDADFKPFEHAETEDKNYMRKIGTYHIRDDYFLVELRPDLQGRNTSLGDVMFVRSPENLPVSGGYLSPYFPAPGSGTGETSLTWTAEIPDGTDLLFKARWVMQMKDGTLRFFPWAKIAQGKEGKLQLSGRGDFFQYSINFVRTTRDDATPRLKMVNVSIPCKETN